MSASQTGRKNVRSTARQIELLLDYMSTHQDFANGEFSGPLGRRGQDREWMFLKTQLAELGPDKTVDQWRVTWRDLKKKARSDAARARTAQAATGINNPPQSISSTTQKVLSIIGTQSTYGISLSETGLGEVIEITRNLPVPETPRSPSPLPPFPIPPSPTLLIVSTSSSIPTSFRPSPSVTSPHSNILPAAVPSPPTHSPSYIQNENTRTSGQRSRRVRGVENKFLQSEAETQNILKEISTNLINHTTQELIVNRRRHLKRLHEYRMEKHKFMAPPKH